MRRISVALLVVWVAVGCAGTTPAPNVTGARIQAADTEPQNWLAHGRTYSEQRFSPLQKITTANTSTSSAWPGRTTSRRGPRAVSRRHRSWWTASSTRPCPWSHVLALEAKTGKLLWEFDPQISGAYGAKGCCDIVNRGVAVWAGKVYVGVFDGQLDRARREDWARRCGRPSPSIRPRTTRSPARRAS